MYRLLIKKTNYLILIEWPRRLFDVNNADRFKGQTYISNRILRYLYFCYALGWLYVDVQRPLNIASLPNRRSMYNNFVVKFVQNSETITNTVFILENKI